MLYYNFTTAVSVWKLQMSLNFDAFYGSVYTKSSQVKFNVGSYLCNKSLTSASHAIATVLNVE
jgi:hypothetical protein